MKLDKTVFFELFFLTIHCNTEKTHRMKENLETTYKDEVSNLDQREIPFINAYISLCEDVYQSNINIETNKAHLINLVSKYVNSPRLSRDKAFKETLMNALHDKSSPEVLSTIVKKLTRISSWYVANNYVNKMSSNLFSMANDPSNTSAEKKMDYLKLAIEGLKNDITDISSSVGEDGPIESIDFSDLSSIKDILEKAHLVEDKGRIVTGIQALNRMLGKRGGFGRGESHVFYGLSHNFKSGLLMLILRWLLKYNKPVLLDKTKKPLIFFVTLENKGHKNMLKIYREHYYALYNKWPSKDMSDEDIVKAIHDLFTSMGYTVIMERYYPNAFSVEQLIRRVEQLTAAGYEMSAVIIDYVEKMKASHGHQSSAMGQTLTIEHLFSYIHNYFGAIGTASFTVHQLNREADKVKLIQTRHKVKAYNPSHISGSNHVHQIVDFDAYIDTEINNDGKKFLLFKRGKHRDVEDTPEHHQFFAVPFTEGGIMDDIDTEDSSVTDIYKDSSGASEDASIASIFEQ